MDLQDRSEKYGNELDSFSCRKIESGNGRKWEYKNVYVKGCPNSSLTYAPFDRKELRVEKNCDNNVVPRLTKMRDRVE